MSEQTGAGGAAPTDGMLGTPADDPVVSVRDLRIWYGSERGPVRAVDGVDLELRRGETLGLVGESGCGKSTLGRGLMDLLPAGAQMDGELRFADEDLLALSRRDRFAKRGPELGMIFQEPLTRLNPLLRVSEHFSETLRTHEPDIDSDEVERRSLDVLRQMGIPPTRFRAYPHEFSGGMRQRLMIALALVLKPAFVVADEPTTALDVLVEAQIIRVLAELRAESDTAMLLITHNLGIIAEACDRVAVMYAGEIVETGDAREVFTRPRHPYTRELLRSTISLRTTGLDFIPGAPPDLVDPPSGCRFHPRCPDAMSICATARPAAAGDRRGHHGGVLGRRPARRRGRPDRRGVRAARAGGAVRCRRSLRRHRRPAGPRPRRPGATSSSTWRTSRSTSTCTAARCRGSSAGDPAPSRRSTGSTSTCAAARCSAWWGSPAAARPHWAGRCWGWRRPRAAGSPTTARRSRRAARRAPGRSARCPSASCGRCAPSCR